MVRILKERKASMSHEKFKMELDATEISTASRTVKTDKLLLTSRLSARYPSAWRVDCIPLMKVRLFALLYSADCDGPSNRIRIQKTKVLLMPETNLQISQSCVRVVVKEPLEKIDGNLTPQSFVKGRRRYIAVGAPTVLGHKVGSVSSSCFLG